MNIVAAYIEAGGFTIRTTTCPKTALSVTLRMHGARIEFEHPHIGPELLTLQIGSADLVKARIPCEVKWRKGKWMGLEFLQPLE